MAGLFTTPEEIAALQAQQRDQQSRLQSPVGGQFFNAGYSSGNAFQRWMGTDTRSPEQLQQMQIQQQLQGLDLTNRDSVIKKIQEFSNNGMYSQAAELMKYVPDPVKPQDQWSEPFPMEIQVGDTTKISMVKRNLANNEIKQITDVTDKANTNGSGNNKPQFKPADLNMSNLDIATQTGFIKNVPGIEGEGNLFTNYSDEEVKPVVGDLKRIANQLANKDELAIFQEQAPSTIRKSPDDYYTLAAQLMMEDPQAWFDKNTIGKGATVKLRSNSRVNLDSLISKRNQRLKREAAQAQVADLNGITNRDVRPNESRGVYDISKVGQTEALNMFLSKDIKSPKDVANTLIENGWNLTADQQQGALAVGTAVVGDPSFFKSVLSSPKSGVETKKKQLQYDAANGNIQDWDKYIKQMVILNYFGNMKYDR